LVKYSLTKSIDMKKLLLAFLVVLSSTLQAQSTIELLAADPNGGPSGIGPVLSATTTLYKTATAAFSPTITATFSISNQQFAAVEGNPGMPGVTIGTTVPSSGNSLVGAYMYSQMNALGGTDAALINPMFTACKTCTAGSGIDINANYGVELFTSTDALIDNAGASTLPLGNRTIFADLTITFNRPVNNPVLHVKGLGGGNTYATAGVAINTSIIYAQGYTSELFLLSPGLSFTKLSGNASLAIENGNFITNHATYYGAASLGVTEFGVNRYAASGSVLVNGTNISTIQLRIYLRGDGGRISDNDGVVTTATNGNNPMWSFPAGFAPVPTSNGAPTTLLANGDAFLMGVSFEEPSTLPVKLISFEAKKIASCATQLNWKTATEINSGYLKYSKAAMELTSVLLVQ
jgi:hypothetical protein